MTNAEVRFLERVPNILSDIVEKLGEISEELKKLNEKEK